jgi:hypothetical protein
MRRRAPVGLPPATHGPPDEEPQAAAPLDDATLPLGSVRHTTSMMLSWCSTRSAFGVGRVWACSESVLAMGAPQKQVAVGAPRGKFGGPSCLRMASLKSPSGSTRHLAVGSVSSQAEALCPAMLLSRAFAIRPSGVLSSRPARSAW